MSQLEGQTREYARANAAAITEMVSGRGPDSPDRVAGSGAHVVANIPAVHVPEFVQQSLAGDKRPYKNGYDLDRYHIGDGVPENLRKTREIVDSALPDGPPNQIYFCAVELNGSGIRFYGDFCLVLNPSIVGPRTTVLDRNSYDLMREPIASSISRLKEGKRAARRKEIAKSWAGLVVSDLATMVAIRTFDARQFGERRLTVGQVGEVLLDDEDYMEVLLKGSFAAIDLTEVRTASADAAADASIGDRMRRGPLPALQEMLWRRSRRRAEAALHKCGVRVKTVTTGGRVK